VAVIDIFSKRQKRLRGEVHDTYRYDDLPPALRVQIVQVLDEAIGRLDDGPSAVYKGIAEALRREYGVLRLAAGGHADDRDDVLEFVLKEECVERVLDVVEVTFRLCLARTRSSWRRENVESAVSEINTRFGEHGVGYQLSSGSVVRMDSEYIHAEVVKPALRLLSDARYSGAQEEFLKAHERFRKGETKEVLVECLKALESVMKSICLERRWETGGRDSVGSLIEVCFQNGLVPRYWRTQFAGLRSILEAGVPPARNRQGGHGQGPVPTTVPKHIAAFVLHQTAAAIVFLAESETALR